MNKESDLIKIDGSYLEGGGQTIRISLCLAAILRKDIEVCNIRSGRSNPGLQKQHLNSALSIIEIFYLIGEDIKMNSQKIIVKNNKEIDSPSEIKKLTKIDVDGAGSIGLVIQELLPALILCNKEEKYEVNIKGGTIVNFSPSTYYLNDVLFPFLKMKYNEVSCNLILNRHGFFPIGQGNIDFVIETKKKMDYFPPLILTTRGKLKKVLVRSIYTSIVNSQDVNKTHNLVLKEVKNIINSYEASEEEEKKRIIKNKDEKNISVEKLGDEMDECEDIDQELDKIYKKDKNVSNFNSSVEIKCEDILLVFHDKKSYTHVVEIIAYFENSIVYHELKYSEKKSYSEESMIKLKRELLIEFEETLYREDKIVDEYTMDHIIIFMALISKKEKSTIITNMLSNHTLTALYIIRLISDLHYSIEIKSYNKKYFNESELIDEKDDENVFVDITEKIMNLSSDELTKYIEALNKNNTTFKLNIIGIL